MPVFTQVGYKLDAGSRATFDAMRDDAGALDSLERAVLKSANSWWDVGMTTPPPKGAKWTDAQGTKYNVSYLFSAPEVIVTDITPR